MPNIVTLTGNRHTDGTIGTVSMIPTNPWYINSGVTTIASGPLYFTITASGTLTTSSGGAATVVPTHIIASGTSMTFVPEGSSYTATITIAGQRLVETWTIPADSSTVDWATIGIKATPSDQLPTVIPLSADMPVRRYASQAAVPAGLAEGAIVYLEDVDEWWGKDSSGLRKIA